MPKIPVTTDCHINLDVRPTSNAPRIRFSERFNALYLEKRTMILEIGCGIRSYTRLIHRGGCIALDIDINAIAKPAIPSSGYIRLFMDTADIKMKIKRSNGGVVIVE
jgi:hypothetical protein